MHSPNKDFHHLTKVTLNEQVGYTFAENRCHTLCRIGARQRLTKQTLSIRYLAAHCYFLRIFRLIPHLGRYACLPDGRGRHLNGTPPQATRPVVLALGELAAKCMTLEEIMIGPLGVLGDRLIVTKDVLANLREDAVVEEAERVSRMMMHEVWM
jgi:hypothetical protein